MSKIEVDAIEPQSGTTLTIGANGDTVAKPTTELETNQYYSWNESIINWEVKTI